MSQVLEWIFVLLILFHYTYGNIGTPENSEVPLKCVPQRKGSLVLWFRVQERGINFIASFSGDRAKTRLDPAFDSKKIANNILILKEFKKARDAGLYSCASINNNELHFGEATRVEGRPEPKPTVKATTKKAPTKAAETVPKCTTEPCQCEKRTNTNKTALSCSWIIWAPVAGGCGLLFIILTSIICYCNRMRTRRCPHHYKRRPKSRATVRQASPDRYV